MQRYKQRFIGSLASHIESDTGDWVKYEDANETMDRNANALFDVIKERNEEIELQKGCIEELNELISKVNRWREDDLKEHQSESRQNFVELQRLGDDLEDSRRRGFKLFTLLVISTVINLFALGAVAMFVFEGVLV